MTGEDKMAKADNQNHNKYRYLAKITGLSFTVIISDTIRISQAQQIEKQKQSFCSKSPQNILRSSLGSRNGGRGGR